MSKSKIKQLRPEKSFADVLAENGVGKGGKLKKTLIDKTFTAMKATDGDLGSGIYTPTAEQMAVINTFTASPKSAEEVIAFDTLSCNDMLDRDDDRFRTECVQDFAKLEGPLSSVGKSFMVSHDYTKLPVGRIFDVGTKSVDDDLFLTNSVYMPNTEQYKNYAENLDFGIYWAVSVGVMLEDSACAICDSPMVGNYWCFCIEQGHEKGLWYDPNSDEKDAWGWALPVEPESKGAVKCTRDLFTPKDFYELSQCFLGAQYDAQIQRSGALKGIVKAASIGKSPMINLSREEAKELPFVHVSEKVREAHAKGFALTTNDEGQTTWKDAAGLVWIYDPSESEVLCLGESNDNEEVNDGEGDEGKDSSTSAPSVGGPVGLEGEVGSADEDEPEGDDDEVDADPEAVEAEADADDEEDDDSDDTEEEDEDDDSDEKSVTKVALLAAAANARLPRDVVNACAAAKGNGLDALLNAASKLIKSSKAKVAELQPKAVLGDKYVEEKRTEAIKWYVKAKQVGGEKGVNVDRFTKMLDRFGADIDLIEEVIEEQKAIAQAKFPASVRRSTAERDVHEIEEPADVEQKMSDKAAEKVRSIHG